MTRSPSPRGGKSSTPDDQLDLPIEAAVEQALRDVVPQRQLRDVSQRVTQVLVQENFSGPLPHPKHLREYNDIIPNGAERILAMAERVLDHNIASGKRSLDAEIADRKTGMIAGAILFGCLILGALGALFISASPVAPGLFLGTAAIGGVSFFVKGRNGK